MSIFIKKINQDTFKKKYINFKNATEACFSIDNHIQTASKKNFNVIESFLESLEFIKRLNFLSVRY